MQPSRVADMMTRSRLTLGIEGSFDAAPNCERHMLKRVDTLAQVNDETCDCAECDLAQDEPPPFDSRVEDWIYHAQRRPQETGPQERRDNRCPKGGIAWEHREHHAVKQSDQYRCDRMNYQRREKCLGNK